MILEDTISGNRQEFICLLQYYCERLEINPDWLMFVMYFESRMNPAAVNKVSGATGLIQFMPTTAQALGTTTEKLKDMSNVEQLPYVYRYLLPYKGKMKSMTDVYLAVFFPAAIGKSDDWVLQTKNLSAKKIADQNPIFDLNDDGQITKGEVTSYLKSWAKKKTLF